MTLARESVTIKLALKNSACDSQNGHLESISLVFLPLPLLFDMSDEVTGRCSGRHSFNASNGEMVWSPSAFLLQQGL